MYGRFNGKVYSVGNGFCYEGLIGIENQYHFVIDCGSIPSSKKKKTKQLVNSAMCELRLEEITEEIANNGKWIDLFVLSHLHQDHYNGYLKLFSKTKVDTIIMPYLYPEERLCILINSDMNEEEALFYANPYQRILEAARENYPEARLVLVRGNKVEQEFEIEHIDSDNGNISWGEPYEDIENILAIEGLDVKNTEVVKATFRGVKIPKPNWMFKFFNVEVDKTEIDDLKKIVGKLDAKRLHDIIISDLTKVKGKYEMIAKHLRGKLNNTSIVVYHAPYCCYEVCCKRVNEKMECRCGSLMTGDIYLNYCSHDILKFFQNEIKTVGLFSLPHHGSKDNWNINFIDKGELDGTVCFSSSYNYYSNRLVPDMLSDLRSHNIQVLVVDENRFSEFEQEIFVDYNRERCICDHELYRPNKFGCVIFRRII